MAKSIEKRATELLTLAKDKAKTAGSWIELSNILFGPGGPVMTLFPDTAERTKLQGTPQYAELNKLLEEMPEAEEASPDYSGKVLVRIPKTIHAALAREAESEGVSVNQLMLAKLCVQLKAVV